MGIWTSEAGAEPAVLDTLRADAGLDLPATYIQMLRMSDGGEGDLGVAPGWIAIWPAQDVLPRNRGYGVFESAPGLFGFATDGGGELFAFDTRSAEPYPIVMVPLETLDWRDATKLADSFDSFRKQMGVQLQDQLSDSNRSKNF